VADGVGVGFGVDGVAGVRDAVGDAGAPAVPHWRSLQGQQELLWVSVVGVRGHITEPGKLRVCVACTRKNAAGHGTRVVCANNCCRG
jgi:hypothetical protein